MENFRQELEGLINKNSLENGSDTPDFILAEYLTACLDAFDKAVNARENWYGRKEENDEKRLQKIVDNINYNNMCARATLFPGKSIDEIPKITVEDLKALHRRNPNTL